MQRLRPTRLAAAVTTTLVLGFLLLARNTPSSADTTIMRGSRAPTQFKISIAGLSEDEKRCVRYALKQWVMYDKAGAEKKLSHPSVQRNRNETSDGVMDPGPDHHIDNAATTNPEKKHTLSSRCMSTGEFAKMKAVYGPTSPFHAEGQEVQNPVTNPDAWFTENPAQADLAIETVEQVPGYSKKVAGFVDYKLVAGTFAGQPSEMKAGPAKCYIRRDPGKTPSNVQRTWCYPSDTDGDGWITNMDTKCPENTLDYYQIIKHEIGHWFCFWHKGAEFVEPIYNNPAPITGLQSPNDDHSCCPHCGGEFAQDSAIRVFFSSNRPGGMGGFDIWSATYDEVSGAYGPAVNLGSPVNSPFDEITPEVSAGDAWLHFASNRPGGLGGFDLYLAARTDTTTWGSLLPLPIVLNSPADDVAPMEWNDRILFASNRGGGYGDWDLWMAEKRVTETTYWDPPVNLGPGVNTPFGERDPMLADWDSDDAVVFFASNRPGGLGAYDIYRSVRENGTWDAPTNLGPGVNSGANEAAPHIPPRNDRILYSTDRLAGAGAGWELFQSISLAPRLYSVAGHDVEGMPEDTVAAPFMVFNDGAMPLEVTPSAWTPAGWTTLYDTQPFHVLPGQFSTLVARVVIPADAAVGDSMTVWLESTAGAAVDSALALILVGPPTAGAGEPGSGRSALVTLGQSAPNPSSLTGAITIPFSLPEPADVTIEVFDAAGVRVASIARGRFASGVHRVQWDGRNEHGRRVASGVYFCRLQAPGATLVRKLVLPR